MLTRLSLSDKSDVLGRVTANQASGCDTSGYNRAGGDKRACPDYEAGKNYRSRPY
jgi:hypothetical protein